MGPRLARLRCGLVGATCLCRPRGSALTSAHGGLPRVGPHRAHTSPALLGEDLGPGQGSPTYCSTPKLQHNCRTARPFPGEGAMLAGPLGVRARAGQPLTQTQQRPGCGVSAGPVTSQDPPGPWEPGEPPFLLRSGSMCVGGPWPNPAGPFQAPSLRCGEGVGVLTAGQGGSSAWGPEPRVGA